MLVCHAGEGAVILNSIFKKVKINGNNLTVDMQEEKVVRLDPYCKLLICHKRS